MFTDEELKASEVLRKKLEKLVENQEDNKDEIIELCFDTLVNCSLIHTQCVAAAFLCRIIKRGLGRRTMEFLDDHPDLPSRARTLLQSNIMRMETF